MNQPNQPHRPSRLLRGLAQISPACLVAAAALTIGGCEHDHEVRVVHERVYEEPPTPPPVVEQTVVEEPVYTPPPTEVVTVYERDLNPYGHWVEIAPYGRCWVPNDRPEGWRPYRYGHWVSSDQGWVWVSEGQDAQFGEVCYHYGRWYEDPSAGWVWVPGSVWGPSWVAWREGGGYCGWAPLPPQCGDGVVVTDVVIDHYIPPERYYVVEERYITEEHIDRHVIVNNNVTIINRTKNITNITYVNNRVVNRGVSVKNVERYSGHPVARAQVARVTTAEEARRLVASGRPAFYAPPEVDRYRSEHPVRVIQPTRRPAGNPPVNVRVDQKTAEQLRAEQEHQGGPTPGQSQAERDAAAQRLRDQHVNENIAHEPTPRVDQKAAEDARLRALQEQKAAQERAAHDTAQEERAAQEKTAQERAAHDRALEERAAQEKAAQERAAHDRALQEKAAQDRAAHDRALEEKAARDRAAQDRAAHDKALEEKAAQEKAAREKALQERAAAEKAQRDAQAEQQRNEKIAEQRAAQERAAQEKAAAREKADQEKAAREKAAQDKAAADKAARDKAAQNKNGQKPDPNNPNSPK